MDPARMFKESLTSRPELENSLGHKRKLARLNGMSDPPPKADIRRKARHVCFVPTADIAG